MFPGQFQKFKSYSPKKPVKSFQDLEVYQKSLESSVFVAKTIMEAVQKKEEIFSQKNHKPKKSGVDFTDNSQEVKSFILKNMTACALSVPHLIAESHSMRFGSSEQCLLVLDKVMLNCNKMAVYLEQVRDICETGLETDQFADQIKKYFFIRQKVLNLQRVWRKYIQINKQENK